jgi:toxin FitB
VILLDTNVVSEMMRSHPDMRVIGWLNAQALETIHLSTISLAELLLGIAVLPDGRRKSELALSLERAGQIFGSRLLSFDSQSAQAFAVAVSQARSKGGAIGLADGLIAAIALAHGFAVATRDTMPFVAAGVAVVDPWSSE